MFFVERERRKVGTIPFKTALLLRVNTVGRVLKGVLLLSCRPRTFNLLSDTTSNQDRNNKTNLAGSLTVTQLDFLSDVDFFGLSAGDLGGVKKATSGALANLANAALARGIPLDMSQTR